MKNMSLLALLFSSSLALAAPSFAEPRTQRLGHWLATDAHGQVDAPIPSALAQLLGEVRGPHLLTMMLSTLFLALRILRPQ